jgi:hypothetical protein
MSRSHYPDRCHFHAVLCEELGWNSFSAYPPGTGLAILVFHPAGPGP